MIVGCPWHCESPMQVRAGYQCGGPNEWIAWKCEKCGHLETQIGHLYYDKEYELWVPKEKG